MLAAVRFAVCLLLGACGFSVPGGAPSDAQDAPKPDVPVTITWEVDATSKIGVPATAQQWRDLMTAAGLQPIAPTNLWLVQETSGALADTIGTIPLVPVNNVSYANTVPGWSRRALGTIDADGDQGFRSNGTGNLDGTSYALLLYASVPTLPAVPRSLAGVGAAQDHRYAAVGATMFSARGSVGSPGVGVAPPGSDVHPLLIEVNMSANPQFAIYTDKEKITAPYMAPQGLGNLVMIGAAGFGSPNARYLYAAMWKGTAAQFSDADAKALLTRLGWTVTGF
jgi:hypothetical protein